MINQPEELNRFSETLQQEMETRQKQLVEHPEEEQNRHKWLEFKYTVEMKWVPVIDEYLTVLGKLWFGEELRLRGPELRKELVSCPAYLVTYRVYGPMAIFWVAENNWEEREVPYSDTERRMELFKRGYRCRIVIQEGGQYHFQDDAHITLIEFDNGSQINRDVFLKVFSDAYLNGPQEIYKRWKNFDIGDNIENPDL